MKRLMLMFCAGLMALNVAADYNYLCGITEVKVDTLQSTTKNQFTVTFKQKCKNTAEYEKESTYYTSTVKLVLSSDDRTLEGVYTTDGADLKEDGNNVNNQKIGVITSEFSSKSTSGSNISRVLRTDVASTFTIEKIDDTHYKITQSTLYFTQRVNKTTNWNYYYSYDADEILKEGIGQVPFVFGYDPEYKTKVYNYDMVVKSMEVYRENSAYDATRYFLVLQCSGKNRDTNAERNYEVALAIYPTKESIAGEFATQGSGTILMAMDSYVKDLKISKQRNLNNDSLSTIKIKDKGNNRYSFYGGTLTCTDLDANLLAVYGKKRIEAAHYYHFSDNDGVGIEFGYNEATGESGLITTGLDAVVGTNGGCRKVMVNGVVYVERNGTLYNLQGQVH